MLLNVQSDKKQIIICFLILTAFLGYVLPYGQMSLWGATVITNLLSAIPWLGKSLVEFVWGGLTFEELNKYKFIFVNNILLYAGISCKIKNVIEYMFSFYIKHVKKSIIIRLSAENNFCSYINTSGRPFEIPGNNSTNLNFSQRLESGNYIYPYLVGLIEGDGWFSVSKKGKYIMYEFGIEVLVRDIQLIYKIKKWLEVGTVHFKNKSKDSHLNMEPSLTPKNIKNSVIFRIRNKSHLKNIILPIFDKYPMFTNKQYDYIRFKSALLSNILYSNELIPYIRPGLSSSSSGRCARGWAILTHSLLGERDGEINNNIKSILNTSYFPAWLVGFIEAESCFSVYKPTDSLSFVASFEVSQTNGEILLLTIRDFLNLSPNIQKDKTNNYRLKVSSVRAVENVIKFMSRAPIKLQGYKKLQYIIWLKNMRNIPRYSYKISIPNKY